MSEFIEITDFSAPTLDIYARLSEPQLLHFYEPEIGIFVAESPKVITRALDAGYQPISFLCAAENHHPDTREVLARCLDIPVYTAKSDVLTQLTGFQLARGLLCAMHRKPLVSIADLCQNARRVAVLENVENPTNVGAIFRNAAALGMDAVLLTTDCSDPLYRRSARVSMGTVFQVDWTFFKPNDDMVCTLRELGFYTAAMALRNDTRRITDPDIRAKEKLAVILGNEGDGLKPETIAACDCTIKIPMTHGVDSLNVAASSAVAFWELGNLRENERL